MTPVGELYVFGSGQKGFGGVTLAIVWVTERKTKNVDETISLSDIPTFLFDVNLRSNTLLNRYADDCDNDMS